MVFQSITPKRGSIRITRPTKVMVAVSKRCSLPSVAQNISRPMATAARRFCGPVMGPSAASSRCTASLPPAIALVSGGSSQRTRK
ncbi:hypothetical protein D3C85_1403560 [compost metagenome]